MINGKGAYRKGDRSQHCGGAGKLIEGSGDVIVGDDPGGAARHLVSNGSEVVGPTAAESQRISGGEASRQYAPDRGARSWIGIRLVDERDQPISHARFMICDNGGTVKTGRLSENGTALVTDIQKGQYKILFPGYIVKKVSK